jgi:hypothetical protein
LRLPLLLFGAVAFAEPVTLRTRIEANGPAVTMGDVFDGAPATSPAARSRRRRRPAKSHAFPCQCCQAAASAAGLEFTPPAGVNAVQVVPPWRRARDPAGGGRRARIADAAVRRGDMVTLVYQAPGMSLTMRARALEDGAIGQAGAPHEHFFQSYHRRCGHRPRRCESQPMSKEKSIRALALLALAAGATAAPASTPARWRTDAVAAPGVAYDAARRAMAPPQLAPIGTPAALTGGAQQSMPQPSLRL